MSTLGLARRNMPTLTHFLTNEPCGPHFRSVEEHPEELGVVRTIFARVLNEAQATIQLNAIKNKAAGPCAVFYVDRDPRGVVMCEKALTDAYVSSGEGSSLGIRLFLAIQPQGKGVGQNLLDYVVAVAGQANAHAVHALCTSEKIKAFFQDQGFEVVREVIDCDHPKIKAIDEVEVTDCDHPEIKTSKEVAVVDWEHPKIQEWILQKKLAQPQPEAVQAAQKTSEPVLYRNVEVSEERLAQIGKYRCFVDARPDTEAEWVRSVRPGAHLRFGFQRSPQRGVSCVVDKVIRYPSVEEMFKVEGLSSHFSAANDLQAAVSLFYKRYPNTQGLPVVSLRLRNEQFDALSGQKRPRESDANRDA